MTTQKLTKEQAERIRKIADEINNLFHWGETKENSKCWYNVCVALYRIADKGEKNLK